MKKLSIFFIFALLLVGFVFILFTLQIISQSKIPGYDLKVNRFRFIQFLVKNNYYDGEGLWRVADITLTGDRQPFMAIRKDTNSPPFQSVTIKKDQKSTTILAHYDSYVLEEQLSLKEDGQKRINQDILSYICVAQTKTKTGLYEKEDCYRNVENYLKNNSGMIFKLERESRKIGFHLVKTAHAAGCIGLVECEPGITTCTCSVGGGSCSQSGTMCNPPLNNGTCICNFSCSGSGGGAMDYYYCNQLSNPISCRNQKGAEAFCNSKGLCSVADGCHWDDGSCGNGSCDNSETCSTCPGDCGTCITCGNGSCNNGETCSTCPGDCGDCVNCISTKGHAELPKDCNKTGFYGRSYAILRDPNRTLPIGETYSCNPYPELIGNGEACGYWSNKWTGYLTIPETGDYEFWITYNPVLILQMDVNENNTFDTSCSNASQDPRAGDNYIFTSASCNTKFRYPYLNSWQIVNGALGGDCWDDYANRIPCEAGRHCEVADLRTEAVSTYPTILTPVPKSERGTTECPVSAVNSGFNNDWAREKGNMDTFFKRSLTAGQVKLNISYTSRVGDELNNQILQFRYRKVSTPALPWVKLWKPASYPNGVCPVTPCQMCMLTAPTSLNFTDQSPTSATLNWTLPTFMGTSQRLLVGSDQSKVNANCPDGTGSGTGCIADVTLGTTATSYAVSGLAPGEIYYWRLVNYKDNDCWRDAVLTMRSGNPSAWWQVKDADVMSDVGLTVKLPDGGYFNLPGPGGYPGVVIYGGTGLVNGNLTGSNVSEKGWIANSSTFKGRPFNSTYFLKNIPTAAKVTNLNLDNPIRIDDLATGGTAYNGYYYYMFNNIDENGDVKVPGRVLTIEPGGTATSLGDRKVILFVKGAGLNIDTNINLNKGKGFFLAVSTGDINISSEVGGGAIPNLEGVYVADGKINIGGKSTPPDLPLWVRGTMVGYSGVGFGRDLNDGNSGTPAELFEYAPDQELLFPVELASHPKFWQEVAP